MNDTQLEGMEDWKKELLKLESSLIILSVENLTVEKLLSRPNLLAHIQVNTDKLFEYIATKKFQWEAAAEEKMVEKLREKLPIDCPYSIQGLASAGGPCADEDEAIGYRDGFNACLQEVNELLNQLTAG